MPLTMFLTEEYQVFGLDYRSLAIFRIVIALIIIGDVLDRCHDLRAHYSDEGQISLALYPHCISGIVTRRLAQLYPHDFWCVVEESSALIRTG